MPNGCNYFSLFRGRVSVDAVVHWLISNDPLTVARGKSKIWKVFSGIWTSLPPRDAKTYRAFGLTQLSVQAYCGTPKLESIVTYYFDCYRNPSCFKDLRRFVALLPVEQQKEFHVKISEHAQELGAKVADEEVSEEQLRVRRVVPPSCRLANTYRKIYENGTKLRRQS